MMMINKMMEPMNEDNIFFLHFYIILDECYPMISAPMNVDRSCYKIEGIHS